MGSFTINPQGQTLVVGANTGQFYATYDPSDEDLAETFGYGDEVVAGTAVAASTVYYAPDGPVRVELTDAAGDVTLHDQIIDVRGGGQAPTVTPQPSDVQVAAKVFGAATAITGERPTDNAAILTALLAALDGLGLITDSTTEAE